MSVSESIRGYIPSIDSFAAFCGEIEVKNKTSLQKAKALFAEAMQGIDPQDCAVFLTGSDGRLEKAGPDSKYELIVLFKEGITTEAKEKVEARIHEITVAHPGAFFEKIEYRICDQQSDVLIYNEKLIPTRAFDSKKIWGTKEMKRAYYQKLFNQIKALNNAKYRKFTDNFRRPAAQELKKTVKSGEGEAKHFSLMQGELIYEGKGSLATKYPCLRSVQYFVADVIFKEVRRGALDEEGFNQLRKMRTVLKKMEALAERGSIPGGKEKLVEVEEAYMKSLYWYALAQQKFVDDNITRCSVSKNELSEVVNTITAFVSARL